MVLLKLAILIGFFSSACEPDRTDNKPDHRENVIKTTLGFNPHFYQRQDINCRKDQAQPNLDEVSVWLFNTLSPLPELSKIRVKLGKTSGIGLANEIIDGVYFLGRMGQDISAGRKGTPHLLYICWAEGGYRADSIENVALAAAYAVTSSYRAFKEVMPFAQIPKVKLFIHPRYADLSRDPKDGEVYERLLTDNLYWTQRETGEQAILVLPHSRERAKVFEPKLWEQPANAAHELGHHIFNFWQQGVGLTGVRFTWQEESRKSRLSSQSMMQLFLEGLQEGFCDCHARYSLAAYFRGLPEYSLYTFINRNIDSAFVSLPFLVDGGNRFPKEFSDELIDIIRFGSRGANVQAFFSEAHNLGAIWSYVIDQVLSSVVPESGAGMEDMKKLKLLHAWAIQLRRVAPIVNAEIGFERFFKELVTSLAATVQGLEYIPKMQIETDLVFLRSFPHVYNRNGAAR